MRNGSTRMLACLVLALGSVAIAPAQTRNANNEEKVLKLVRAMVVSWDITEIGAPTIDPEIPYGSSDLLSDIKRISAAGSDEEAMLLHRQTKDGLERFLRHARLRPGKYSYDNLLAGKSPEFTVDIRADIDPQNQNAPTVTFEFKQEHLKLLRVAAVRWNEWDLEEGEEFHATPGIDPKRPYGNMTFFYADMADALGIAFKNDADLLARKDFFLHLHREMQPALQVFLKHAQMPARKQP